MPLLDLRTAVPFAVFTERWQRSLKTANQLGCARLLAKLKSKWCRNSPARQRIDELPRAQRAHSAFASDAALAFQG